jgi:copper chaperone CopZ
LFLPLPPAVSFQVEGSLSDQKQAVREEVLVVPGVRTCEAADGQTFEVTFYGDSNMANHIAIIIGQKLGGLTVYHQDNVSTFFHVEDMTCGSCTETVRRAASVVEGVKFCSVHLKRELCGVVMPRAMCNAEAVIAAIEAVGFGAKTAVANRV